MFMLRCLLIGALSGSLAAAQILPADGVIVRPNATVSVPTALEALSPGALTTPLVAHAIARSFAVLSIASDDERARGQIASVLAQHGCHADLGEDLAVASLDHLLMMTVGIGIEALAAELDTALLHESRDCRVAKSLLDGVRRGEVTEDNFKAVVGSRSAEPSTAVAGDGTLAATNAIEHYLLAPIVWPLVRAFATYVLLKPEVGNTPTLLDHEIAEAQREVREALVREFLEDRAAFHERVEERERRDREAQDAPADAPDDGAAPDSPSPDADEDAPATDGAGERDNVGDEDAKSAMGSMCDAPRSSWDPALEDQCAAQRTAEFAAFVATLQSAVERCPMHEAERVQLGPNDPRSVKPASTCDEHAALQDLARLTVSVQAACNGDCVDAAIAERRRREEQASVNEVLDACIGPHPHVHDPRDAERFDDCERARAAHSEVLNAYERTLAAVATAFGVPTPPQTYEPNTSGWPSGSDPSSRAESGVPPLPSPEGFGGGHE